MSYDLRREAWLPFRRRSGKIEWADPSRVTDGIAGEDPIVALACPRPDFNGAVTEFLIGLYSVALKPADERAWKERDDHPPTPDEIRLAMDMLPNAFDLDNDGPRFLQDVSAADFSETEPSPIENLLIDAAGAQTQRLNKDLFVKRERARCFSRAGAAMALITLQTYAPSGGQGHRTSMRGGGPLTTLADPRVSNDGADLAHEQPLWRFLWANVETCDQARERQPQPEKTSPSLIWPWLDRTRTSNEKAQGRPVYPQESDPYQSYFGMPRRIRIDFADERKHCDVTTQEDSRTTTQFRMLNYGVQYVAWHHPFTPTYTDGKGQHLPVHAQPDGLGWKDWSGLVFVRGENAYRPAPCILAFQRRARGRRFAVRAFGYDMDNMKARAWIDATLPAWAVPDAEQARIITIAAEGMTEAAEAVASLCFVCVRTALFESADEVKGDLSHIKASFLAMTESDFYAAIAKVVETHGQDELPVVRAFADPLRRAARRVFDDYVDMDALDVLDAQRIVLARNSLELGLQGYGKFGKAFFAALGLASPEKKEKKSKGGAP